LIAIKAEDIARSACEQISRELDSKDSFRVMLVVVDEPKNGWTQRFLTDADWRFSDKIALLPKKSAQKRFDRWVVVNLWTIDSDMNLSVVTQGAIVRLTRAAIFRAYFQRQFGFPKTLADAMRQEGQALNFAKEAVTLQLEELELSSAVMNPYLNSSDFSVIFAAMYGDTAAISVGYQALGLKPMAGFAVAQNETRPTNY